MIDHFLAAKESKLRPSSMSEAQRYLLRDWKPLHGWPIAEIQLPQVADILDRLEKSGPVSAARSRSYLSSLFRWAMGRGYVQHHPVLGTINPDPRNARERVLSDRELAMVWDHCQGDDDYSRIIRLLILTGQRRSEVGGMMWSELNFDDRTWTIPARAKNQNAHVLSLPQACWSIIEGIERRACIDHLFGYNHGYRSWSGPKEALDKRCAIPAWTHHDLRRSVATGMADIEIKPHIIEQVLNHQGGHKAGVAGIYNRSSYTREVKTALAIWADHVASIVGGEERKILQFPAETR